MKQLPKDKSTIIIMVLISILAIISIGYGIYQEQKFKKEIEYYKDISWQLCNLDNNLTDVVNRQGRLITKLTGESLPDIEDLDCYLINEMPKD